MRRSIVHSLFFFFIIITPTFVYGVKYLALGLEAGYAPNMLAMKDQFEALQLADRRITQKMVEAKDYYGDRVTITDFRTDGGELVSLPFGINLRFLYKRIFLKVGFLYHAVLPNQKSYVLNTKGGIDPVLASKGTANNFYDDYYLNHDANLENDVPAAIGLVPTDGKDYYYQSVVFARIIEVPVTFGYVLVGKEFYKFYLGLGMSYFNAFSSRTITVQQKVNGELTSFSGPNSGKDVDEFVGSAVGFHFLMGSEFQVTKRIGLYMEMAYSIGAAVPLTDRVQTGAHTVESLFHQDQATDQKGLDGGGSEVPGSVNKPGLPRISGLNFEHYRLSIGISYSIFFDSPPRVKIGKLKKQKKDSLLE
ncbi:MAG: hypothetical protein D6767_10005 [Candidatus Hydrogenedentota bacterium]|nr:MAG: hypothetical protein D6767_10005 [Candidatus Hydrogenedentota bacterium]